MRVETPSPIRWRSSTLLKTTGALRWKGFGIPLPGTGAWTGTLAASLLDMDFKSSVLAVMLGVLLAGIIMGAASAGLFGALFAVFS